MLARCVDAQVGPQRPQRLPARGHDRVGKAHRHHGKAGSPKTLNGPRDTPLVNQAAELRPDLCGRCGALKKHAGYVCATQRTACFEVRLAYAGNEFNHQQWRHAKPCVQIAEDQLFEAKRLTQSK